MFTLGLLSSEDVELLVAIVGFLDGNGMPPSRRGLRVGNPESDLLDVDVAKEVEDGLLIGDPDVFDNVLTPVHAVCWSR